MKRLTVLALALLLAGCATKHAPITNRCTCVLGNDWESYDEARAANYDIPEECAIHGSETE